MLLILPWIQSLHQTRGDSLFTAAGLDSFLLAGESSTGLAIAMLTTALVFPFWLWGPLLALATWGYALHRRTEKL